jgi:hypothetical protein
MPKSIAGPHPCNRKPTPRPIAIQTPILRNTMSRKRNRECTSFSLVLSPDGPLSHRPSRRLPLIMMMEASYLRQGPHLAHFRWHDSSGVGAIHIKGKMGAKAMVIGEIRGKHAPEMPLVEDDDMIEHLAAETPDEPLAVGILPRTARGDLDFFDSYMLNTVLERHTVDRVPIPGERARRGIPGKRLNDLLSGPLRRGMFSNIEMHNATAFMGKHDEDKEHAACGGRDEKKIAVDTVEGITSKIRG